MKQVLFYLPIWHIPVYGYGVMMVVGFIAGMYLAQYLARRSGLDPETFANAAILALITGVLGARFSHVLENLPSYTRPDLTGWDNFRNAINIREGGLTYYGGFLLAFPSLVLYALWKKVPLPKGMDIIAPCLMVGLAFGRIGCFLNGCCYGADCNVPWAAEFPYGSDAYITQFNDHLLKTPVPRALIRDHSELGEYMDGQQPPLTMVPAPMPPEMAKLVKPDTLTLKPKTQVEAEKNVVVDEARHTTEGELAAQQHANPVHPAEIYSAATAFLIAAFLVAYYTLPHVPGRVFAAMMMIEGVFRYVLEMLRVEPAVVGRGTDHFSSLPPQSYSMVVSFVLVVFGIALWFIFGRIAAGKQERGIRGSRPATA